MHTKRRRNPEETIHLYPVCLADWLLIQNASQSDSGERLQAGFVDIRGLWLLLENL